jgi:hypothetical protein
MLWGCGSQVGPHNLSKSTYVPEWSRFQLETHLSPLMIITPVVSAHPEEIVDSPVDQCVRLPSTGAWETCFIACWSMD